MGTISECTGCKRQGRGGYVRVKCGVEEDSRIINAWGSAGGTRGYTVKTTYRILVDRVFFVCWHCVIRKQIRDATLFSGVAVFVGGCLAASWYLGILLRNHGFVTLALLSLWLVYAIGAGELLVIWAIIFSLLPLFSRIRGEVVNQALVLGGMSRKLKMVKASRL